MKIILAAGARPNFMKVAPLVRAIEEYNASVPSEGGRIDYLLVHTGQHYDFNMSDSFFKDLKLPQPHIYLGVGSGTHAEQTGKVMMEFEKVLLQEGPDLVVVVGDVNSTLACTLVSVKLNIPVAHVEAGLRSFDRSMPEEINRLVTDALSTYLFTPSPDADENLLKEGVPAGRIYQVGDIMVDSLLFHLDEAKKSDILARLGLLKGSSPSPNSVVPYALLTLHRPSNVDNRQSLQKILSALELIAPKIPIIFPIHPRTQKQLGLFNLQDKILFHDIDQVAELSSPGIHGFDPLGYLDFLSLMISARFVLTDSGGIQEETTVLGVPCLTLRDTTERPITISEGT
ncbi:MAG: UDP-N-acetylglucosamine 2-epimerase (non-hydrolyzing), partial [Deltaproteobacteria bacterium]|nr:UDP-N-acetylglucosamine 2-epimerase (non-hydrolyzing) [Deltaproteobacteria bacterium]